MARRGQPWGMVYVDHNQSGPVWRARMKLPVVGGGRREVRPTIGPAWLRKSAPPDGFFNERSAREWLDRELAKARLELSPSPSANERFEEVARDWLLTCELEKGLKPSTLRDYRSVVNQRLIPAFGQKRVSVITPTDVANWVRSIRTLEVVAVRTVNKYLANLHAIFEHAIFLDLVRFNPVSKAPKIRDQRPKEIRIYSTDEAVMIITAARTIRDRAFFAVAVYAGLRLGETRALRWCDIDFVESWVHVRQAFSGNEVVRPKGGKARRVPLIPVLASWLAQLKEVAQAGDRDYVFCASNGRPVNDAVMRKRFYEAVASAELPRYRFHDLRHTFGTIAITRASPIEVQAWMGHANLATTQIYLTYRTAPDEVTRLTEAFQAPSTVTTLTALR